MIDKIKNFEAMDMIELKEHFTSFDETRSLENEMNEIDKKMDGSRNDFASNNFREASNFTLRLFKSIVFKAMSSIFSFSFLSM